MLIIGYYWNCDDAVCLDCHNDGTEWKGFDDWENPLPIFDDEKSDTPTHCCECEDLIPHDLTSEGYRYVEEAVVKVLSGGGGRPEIVLQWFDQYKDGLDLDEIIRLAINDVYQATFTERIHRAAQTGLKTAEELARQACLPLKDVQFTLNCWEESNNIHVEEIDGVKHYKTF